MSELSGVAYAVFDSEDGSLTIFRDEAGKYTNGQVIGSKTYYAGIEDIKGEKLQKWSDKKTSVTKVVIEDIFRPKTAYHMFHQMIKLIEIEGIENLDTSECTNTAGMFYICNSLTELDLSSFNTSNVTDMSDMFYNCNSLTELDLSSFNTSNVTEMWEMFCNCNSLTKLDLSSFNTSNVTDMWLMFKGCSSLINLDLSSFNTSNVTDMWSMFADCSELIHIYIIQAKWNLDSVTNSGDMFDGCTNLRGPKGTTYNSSKVNAAYAHLDGGPSNPGYFDGCVDKGVYDDVDWIIDIDYTLLLGNEEEEQTFIYRDYRYDTYWPWYEYGDKISYVKFDGVVRGNGSHSGMFYGCRATDINLLGFDTSNITIMSGMFGDCRYLTSLDLSKFNTSNVTNMYKMFYFCLSLTFLDLSSFNTSKVKNMGWMFRNCESLTSLDIDYFNTSEVTDMGYMFSHCTSLKTINLNNFNNLKVTTMEGMFYNCQKLVSLNLNNFTTSNVVNMMGMFYDCIALPSLDLSGFDTSKVENMGSMFYNNNKLQSLNLDSFDTTNVENMHFMFGYCNFLTFLNLSNFDFSRALSRTGVRYMFYGCRRLTTTFNMKRTTPRCTSMFKDAAKTTGRVVIRYFDPVTREQAQQLADTKEDGNVVVKKADGEEAYAVYNNVDQNLIFFRDEEGVYTNGQVIGRNKYYTGIESTGGERPPWNNVIFSFNRAIFEDIIKPTSCYYWFGSNTTTWSDHPLSIDNLKKLDTSEVNNMANMFRGCITNELDLSGFKTTKVENMSGMFLGFEILLGLDPLDLSSFDTSSVTNMKGMFAYSNIFSLNLSSFNTSKVTDMTDMFFNSRVKKIPILYVSNCTLEGLGIEVLVDNIFSGTFNGQAYLARPSDIDPQITDEVKTFWRDVANDYSTVHFEYDDADEPKTSIQLTRGKFVGEGEKRRFVEDDSEDGIVIMVEPNIIIQNNNVSEEISPNDLVDIGVIINNGDYTNYTLEPLKDGKLDIEKVLADKAFYITLNESPQLQYFLVLEITDKRITPTFLTNEVIITNVFAMVEFRQGGHGMSIGKLCMQDGLEVSIPTRIGNELSLATQPIDPSPVEPQPTDNPKEKGWYEFDDIKQKYYKTEDTEVQESTTYYEAEQEGVDLYNYQLVIGKYNKEDEDSAFIIGNGDRHGRSNALTIDWDGNVTTTGNLYRKQINVDASKTDNNVSGITYPCYIIADGSDRVLTRLESVINPNGSIGSFWYVRNYNTAGEAVGLKGISMHMDKTGALTYNVSDNAKFHTALGEANWVIEEYHTNEANKWSYRKWNNGAVELWSVHYWASMSWTAYLGTGLYYGNFTSYAYPFNVYTSQDPVMTGNVRYVNANVGWLANLNIADNTHCKGTVVRNGNSGSVYVSLHVNGWWK